MVRTLERDHEFYRSLVGEQIAWKQENLSAELLEEDRLYKCYMSVAFFSRHFTTPKARGQFVDQLARQQAQVDQMKIQLDEEFAWLTDELADNRIGPEP